MNIVPIVIGGNTKFHPCNLSNLVGVCWLLIMTNDTISCPTNMAGPNPLLIEHELPIGGLIYRDWKLEKVHYHLLIPNKYQRKKKVPRQHVKRKHLPQHSLELSNRKEPTVMDAFLMKYRMQQSEAIHAGNRWILVYDWTTFDWPWCMQ